MLHEGVTKLITESVTALALPGVRAVERET